MIRVKRRKGVSLNCLQALLRGEEVRGKVHQVLLYNNIERLSLLLELKLHKSSCPILITCDMYKSNERTVEIGL